MRDIEAHLAEIYGVQVSRELASRVTDAVMDDVRDWSKRPLRDIYPIVFLDCMVLKIREGGTVARRALYLALGVTLDGDRDVLGMHHKRDRGAQPPATQSDQDEGQLPQRGRRPQAALPRCRTPSRNGQKRATGQSLCSCSRSTSETASPTPQTDRH
jgi:hypothetical protein